MYYEPLHSFSWMIQKLKLRGTYAIEFHDSNMLLIRIISCYSYPDYLGMCCTNLDHEVPRSPSIFINYSHSSYFVALLS